MTPDDQTDLDLQLTGSIEAMLESADDPDIKHNWPRTLVNMADVATAAIAATPPALREDARTVAERVVVAIAHFIGGRPMYLPRDDRLHVALRNARIWSEFSGNNVPELAERYRLTPAQLYNILNEQRALHRKRVQPELF